MDGSDQNLAQNKPGSESGSGNPDLPDTTRPREAGRDADISPSVPSGAIRCPDVVAILTKSGQVRILADRHQVDEWDVTAVLGEFVDYWTAEERPETEPPGRALRSRGKWLLDAQGRVTTRAREGFLRGAGKAPGLVEHFELKVRTSAEHDPLRGTPARVGATPEQRAAWKAKRRALDEAEALKKGAAE